MKTSNPVKPISDKELITLINEFAVERGLRVPQTAEEVRLFEEKYSNEIRTPNLHRKDLKELLDLAQKLKATKTPLVNPIEKIEIKSKYQLAARNGKEISSEIEDKMDNAVKKAKEKQQDDQQ